MTVVCRVEEICFVGRGSEAGKIRVNESRSAGTIGRRVRTCRRCRRWSWSSVGVRAAKSKAGLGGGWNFAVSSEVGRARGNARQAKLHSERCLPLEMGNSCDCDSLSAGIYLHQNHTRPEKSTVTMVCKLDARHSCLADSCSVARLLPHLSPSPSVAPCRPARRLLSPQATS